MPWPKAQKSLYTSYATYCISMQDVVRNLGEVNPGCQKLGEMYCLFLTDRDP